MKKTDKEYLNIGDPKRFLSLLMPAQKRIFTYVLYHIPNRNDCDDVFQETMATMWGKFEEYVEGTNFLSWSLRIAKFKILSFYRDNSRKKVFCQELDDIVEQEMKNNIDSLDEESRALKACIQKLAPKHKQYLYWRYHDDKSFRQIARQVNISMQSVHRTFSRMHLFLVKCIQTSLKESS